MMAEKEMEKKTDEELVSLSLKDPAFFRILVGRYEKRLFFYVLRLSRLSREDAEDLLQDIFLSVYRNLNDFDRDLKFSSWIYRIAHNRTVSFWRKNKNRERVLSQDEEMKLINLPSSENLSRELEIRGDAEEVQKTLKKISKKSREVLLLRFFEDKSYEEISDILEKPMGTVATLLSRAKKEMLETMDKNSIKA